MIVEDLVCLDSALVLLRELTAIVTTSSCGLSVATQRRGDKWREIGGIRRIMDSRKAIHATFHYV